jgi:hypothetical protein
MFTNDLADPTRVLISRELSCKVICRRSNLSDTQRKQECRGDRCPSGRFEMFDKTFLHNQRF